MTYAEQLDAVRPPGALPVQHSRDDTAQRFRGAFARGEAPADTSLRGPAALQLASAEPGRVVQHTVNPVPTARLDGQGLLGDGSASHPGLTVGELQAYVVRQADWFADPSLSDDDRNAVWRVLHFLDEGTHVGAAVRPYRIADVAAVSGGDWAALREYARGFDGSAQTIRLSAPAASLARAIELGQAMVELAVFVPAPVLRVVIPESGLAFLVDNNKLPALLQYYLDFSPTLEHPDEWPHVETLLNEGVSSYSTLQGWIHDLHIFTVATRQRLLSNVADTSRSTRVVLILFSGLDWNTAFMSAANIEAIVLDARNLALVVQGPASLGEAAGQVQRVAQDYGQGNRLSQVVLAGHGSETTVEMASAGANPQNRDDRFVEYDQTRVDSGDPAGGTQALIDTIINSMDPASASIVFAGCLVGSHDVPEGTDVSDPATAAANLQAALAANPNLSDYVRQRMAALGVTGDVTAASGSTTFSALTLDASGRATLRPPDDPNVAGPKLEYVRTGVEPEGALRAVLEIYADPAIGPAQTTTEMRSRVTALAGVTEWRQVLTREAFALCLPAAPAQVDIAKVLNLSHRVVNWLLAGWVDSIDVQALANSLTSTEAPSVFPAMLTTHVSGNQALLVGINEAWMQHDPSRGTQFMTALTASHLNVRTFSASLLVRAILDPHLGALLPAGGAPTRGQMLLALSLAVGAGASMPAPARTFLRAAAGGSTTSSFPSALHVPTLLAGASELQVLRDIGLAPGAPGQASVDANVDTDDDATNETYVAVSPGMSVVTDDNTPVRSAPDASAGVIAQLSDGDMVRVMGTTDSWTLIDLNGQRGFVHTDNLYP